MSAEKKYCKQCGADLQATASLTTMQPGTPSLTAEPATAAATIPSLVVPAPPAGAKPGELRIVEQTTLSPADPWGDPSGPVATQATTAARAVGYDDLVPTVDIADPPAADTATYPASTLASAQQQPPVSRQHDAIPSAPFDGALEPPSPRQTRTVILAVIAAVTGLTAVVGSFLEILTISSDAPIQDFLGSYLLNDLGATNLQVVFIVAGIALLAGAVLLVAGHRFGAGLAAGASLGFVAFVGAAWASTVVRSDLTTALAAATGQGTFIEAKTGVGLFVLIGAAGLGLIAVIIAFTMSSGGRRLNAFVCVAGVMAAVAAALGQLIPEGDAAFADNFDTALTSSGSVYSRLGIVAVVLVAGVFGFARRDRFGIGLAIGALSPYAWQWGSSITEAGERPFPPAFGNPGDVNSKPYIVTTIGIIAMLLLATVAMFAPTSSRHQP